jgi:DNA-binding transcriptional ArsR family regulator
MTPEGPLPTTRFVLLALLQHMKNDDIRAFPSVDCLVEETGLSRSTVREHLRKAAEAGYLKIINRFNNNKQSSNLYIGIITRKGADSQA